MTKLFDIAARIAFEPGPEPSDAAVAQGLGLPVGLNAVLVIMVCAAIGAMVLKRRLPDLPLLACLSALIAFGALTAALQTGEKAIAMGGFCVILGLYMLDYFSRVMASVEQDASLGRDAMGQSAPSRQSGGATGG